MNVRAVCILSTVLLAACASTPAPPAWQGEAHVALQGFTSAYLGGNTRVADVEFARARHALTATGSAERVAQAELVRCAVRTASLEFDSCDGFAALAQDATPAQRAYADYLAGRWQGLDAALLPAQHRALLAGGTNGALAAIEDPLARLVAAGSLLRSGRLTPADIELATETASAQGWRRPLLAWLGVQAQRARQAGAQEALRQIERRIELVAGTPE